MRNYQPIERIFQYLPPKLHHEIVMDVLKEIGITEEQLLEAKKRVIERAKRKEV